MKEKLCLSLLALVVIASGCINNTSDEPQGSIHVDYLNFIPQDREIFTGGTVNVNMKISNIGEAEGTLQPGEDGSEILTNYCPYLFNEPQYQESGDGNLAPGESMTLSWDLQQEGDVLSVGSSCQMEFRLPFNYSGSVYRQVQIRESESIAEAKKLGYESSSGPLKFEVATITPSGSSPTFTMPEEGRTKTVTVLMRLRNTRGEQGSIDVHERTLNIKAPALGIDEGFGTVKKIERCSSGSSSGSNGQTICLTVDEAVEWKSHTQDKKTHCNFDELEPLTMYNSKSRVIRCNVELPEDVQLDSSSEIAEIQASVDYTYTKDLPSRKVKVNTRG